MTEFFSPSDCEWFPENSSVAVKLGEFEYDVFYGQWYVA